MARIFEIKKGVYRRDVCIFGHRLFSFLRRGVIVDSILHHLEWQADYRTLHQHGIELPGESAYYWTGHYEVVNVRLGDLRRFWTKGPMPLSETDLFRFAKGDDKDGLSKYYAEMGKITAHSKESAVEEAIASMRLFKTLENAEYDPSICCITVNDSNVILDGFHRSVFLLARHGPDYKVKVVRVLPDFR